MMFADSFVVGGGTLIVIIVLILLFPDRARPMKLLAVVTVIACAIIAWCGGYFAPLPPGARWE